MRKTIEDLTHRGLPALILQRVITREPDSSEESKFVTRAQFQDLRQQGEFVLSWFIYNTSFGIPRKELFDFLSKGYIVLVNVSRETLFEARRLFPESKIVYVKASPAICEDRIRNRQREVNADLNDRIERLRKEIEMPSPNLIINNENSIEKAVEEFSSFLRDLYKEKSWE